MWLHHEMLLIEEIVIDVQRGLVEGLPHLGGAPDDLPHMRKP